MVIPICYFFMNFQSPVQYPFQSPVQTLQDPLSISISISGRPRSQPNWEVFLLNFDRKKSLWETVLVCENFYFVDMFCDSTEIDAGTKNNVYVLGGLFRFLLMTHFTNFAKYTQTILLKTFCHNRTNFPLTNVRVVIRVQLTQTREITYCPWCAQHTQTMHAHETYIICAYSW